MKKKPKKVHNNLCLGKKVKSILTENKYNKSSLLAFLIVFNLMLSVSLIFLIIFINTLAIYIISALLFVYCGIHSVITYIKSEKILKYIIFENFLVVNTLLYSAKIQTKNILDVKPVKTWFDKLFKLKTNTLEITYTRTLVHKIKLPFIAEDTDEIIKTLMHTSTKQK